MQGYGLSAKLEIPESEAEIITIISQPLNSQAPKNHQHPPPSCKHESPTPLPPSLPSNPTTNIFYLQYLHPPCTPHSVPHIHKHISILLLLHNHNPSPTPTIIRLYPTPNPPPPLPPRPRHNQIPPRSHNSQHHLPLHRILHLFPHRAGTIITRCFHLSANIISIAIWGGRRMVHRNRR